MRTHTYSYTYVYVNVYKRTRMYIHYIDKHSSVFEGNLLKRHVNIYIHVHIYVYIQIYTYTYIQICTYTYIQICSTHINYIDELGSEFEGSLLKRHIAWQIRKNQKSILKSQIYRYFT